jgi:hypothetical protein
MPSVTLTCSSVIFQVEGQLPLELGSLTELLQIDVRVSDLSAGSGSIPKSITLCSKLKRIALFRNKMRGIIPKDIYRKPDLSGNHLYKRNWGARGSDSSRDLFVYKVI